MYGTRFGSEEQNYAKFLENKEKKRQQSQQSQPRERVGSEGSGYVAPIQVDVVGIVNGTGMLMGKRFWLPVHPVVPFVHLLL